MSSPPEPEPKPGRPVLSADSRGRARGVAAALAIVLLEVAWVAVLAVVAWRLLSSFT